MPVEDKWSRVELLVGVPDDMLVSFEVVLHTGRYTGLLVGCEQLVLHAHAFLKAQIAELRDWFGYISDSLQSLRSA